MSVVESVILFDGHTSIKQYNTVTPIKSRYKLWCIGDQKGCILNLNMYEAKIEALEKKFESCSFGERVVLGLSKRYWVQCWVIYYDKFMSFPLLEKAKIRKHTCLWYNTNEQKRHSGEFYTKEGNEERQV